MALVPAGSPVAADSGRPASTMTMNTPPAARGGWGGVPDAPLNPPAPQPGGWGANGWHGGGPGGPMAGMPGPGGPQGPRPGGPGAMQPGGPAGPGRAGGWHGGGRWQGQYPHVGRGQRLSRFWLSPDYYLSDWGRYGLWQPGYGQNWIRYYDDALLIDGGGRVLDGRYDLDWDRGNYDHGYGYGDDDYGYAGGEYDHGGGYGHGGVTVHRGPGTTVVVVQNQPSVTTTTTTTYEDVVRHPHKRTWRPRCRCR